MDSKLQIELKEHNYYALAEISIDNTEHLITVSSKIYTVDGKIQINCLISHQK